MSEPFKTRVETTDAPQGPQEPPQATKEVTSDKLAGFEDKATDPLTAEEKKLEIWEGLKRHRYGEDYFNIKNIVHEFPLKAEFGFIDKFVKAEMEAQDMAMTIENYESFIRELEEELGTSQTETYKRINKIFNYLKTLRKYREIKEKKDAYKRRAF